jgi:hypothetical protein
VTWLDFNESSCTKTFHYKLIERQVMYKYLFLLFLTLPLNAANSDLVVLEIENENNDTVERQSNELTCCNCPYPPAVVCALLPLAFLRDASRISLWSLYYVAEFPRFLVVSLLNFYLCCADEDAKKNLEGFFCYSCINSDFIDQKLKIDAREIKLKDMFKYTYNLLCP